MSINRITVQFDKAPEGENWYPPEKLAKTASICWSGPGTRATLKLPISRIREILVIVAYHKPVIEEQITGLRVEIDGALVPHWVRSDINPKCIVTFLPARSRPSNATTELSLILPRTVSPSGLISGPTDVRQLGIAVHSVSALPVEPSLPLNLWISRFGRLKLRIGLSRMDRLANAIPFSHFDGLTYLRDNPDVAKAVIAGQIFSALEHYRNYGYAEQRMFTIASALEPNQGSIDSLFDGIAYLERYPDVAQSVRSDRFSSALQHFLRHGSNEGRSARMRFDGLASRGTGLDLARMDAARLAEASIDKLKMQLNKKFETHSNQLGSEITRIQSIVSNAVRKQDLESARGEFRDAMSRLNVLREDLRRIELFSRDGLAKVADLPHAHEAQERKLLLQIDSLRVEMVELQKVSVTTARAEELERIQREAALEVTALGARERALIMQIDSLESRMTDVYGRLSETAPVDQLQQIRSELVSALAWEQSYSERIDGVISGLTKAHEAISAAARHSDLAQLRRDTTHELDRVRGEITNALTMREAREQAVLEQIELLRISLDESQRRLSMTARIEDVDRLKRDASLDLERVRSEIAAVSAIEKAREQALFAQVDTLKAQINAATTRAELAEIKVESVRRDLGAETHHIAESIQKSAAELDHLQKEIAEQGKLRESKESVIRSEVDLVKHELYVAQVSGHLSPAARAPRDGNPAKSWSQLGQDLWVIERSGFKNGGYFVDIGATDGVLLNNTYLLETQHGWKGVCVEPDPNAFQMLSKQRKALCSNACLWSASGEEVEFILAREYGAIEKIADRDNHADKRSAYKKIGETIKLKTTSLNDLLDDSKAPPDIDYISLDTEGSEYEILRTFDFNRWKVKLWTIEHNHAAQRDSIYNLMKSHGYKRREVKFDDWYYL